MQKERVKLTQMTTSSGCAAKLGPGTLAAVLANIPVRFSPQLLVGHETADDAAVYKISDDLAIIQTVDFFTPVIDDPYQFGQVAVANALSDVYAMGGKPVMALNIVCFPEDDDLAVLREIMRGGAAKMEEADVTLAGGHSVGDPEPKYGLCVMGMVNPKDILKNSTAQVGDVLILTKAVGTGLLNTALKAGISTEKQQADAYHSMSTLNRVAAETMMKYEPSCCTDITGFGFVGHCYEVAKGSNVTLELDSTSVPILEGALEYAQMGIIPAGTYRNGSYVDGKVAWDESVQTEMKDLLLDPQTSGGLLITVKAERAMELLKELKEVCPTPCAIVGKVIEKGTHPIVVR